ncbi:MAG: peptide-methionine (R)-S-oxide reductase MsrB [Ostreibacterium sp.]
MLKWQDIINCIEEGNPNPSKRIDKTPAEWQSQLTPEQYRVTRLSGTERPFSSDACTRFESGQYVCICCDNLLFDGQHKFNSGSGWPSFTQPVAENVIAYHHDSSQAMLRVEALCNVCNAHLGHVFPDGPTPSGLRYCMNAVALSKKDIIK